MNTLPEETRNDLRRIGGELSRLSFDVLTVVGIGDQDDLNHKRLTEVMDHIDQALSGLAEIITGGEDDDEELE
ncbi:hypothetical protein [Spirosoma pollinicola]|nr:hypothetical protein [Spirosoma pollinicola]